LRLVDFLKGTLYITFLTPTYINIFSIYAISNIHDVSWGSRPAGNKIKSKTNRDKAMEEEYMNYRSKFLVIWVVINNGIGFTIVYISRSSQITYLFVIAVLLAVVIFL
jgi:lipoprotein signal peptidase